MASLLKIWLKRVRRGPMDPVEHALLDARGLRGNANRGGRRQVTIISAERWAGMMESLAADLDPSRRRANLLISGLDLERTRGRLLRVGPALLRINGETRPCEQMEQAMPGLQAVMGERWGGGIFAEVVRGGEIAVGDLVGWDEGDAL